MKNNKGNNIFLNPIQQEAVNAINGPCRIIAGPGSGKTRTIISKVEYLLVNDITTPDKILVITFTNKSAQEIKDRIELIGFSDFKNVFTYHGLAFRFLKSEIQNLYEDAVHFSIIDSKEQDDLISQNIKLEKEELLERNKNINLDLTEIKSWISKIRFDENIINNVINELDDDEETDYEYFKSINNIYKRYLELKKLYNFYDFDDLLFYFNYYLEKFPHLQEKWQEKYDYFFIDEFQDTNDIQYQIIKKITKRDSNITVVGDPDQNIYSWRGANIDIILNFSNDFDNVKTFILNQNYRSVPNILKWANNLISNNKNRISFENVPIKQAKIENKNQIIVGYSRQDEANKVVEEIERLHKNKNISYDDIAIIYRANFLSREFEGALVARGIKYRVIGGFKFFDRKEVKEVLSFFKFLIFRDNFSLMKIINVPIRGIGPKTIHNYTMKSAEMQLTIWEFISNNNIKVNEHLKRFIDITNKYLKRIDNVSNAGETIGTILKNYLIDIHYFEYYENSFSDEKIININNLISQIEGRFTNFKSLKNVANDFFNEIALYSSADDETITDHITLITAHASKGTEYKCVFFVGFNEKIIPSYRSLFEKEFEEERRIAYVGLTRAKEYLYISYTEGWTFNSRQLVQSPFLEEILSESNEIENLNNIHSERNAKKQSEAKINDIIHHNYYGEGVIVGEDERYIRVAFKKPAGIKQVIKNHPSWFLKK